MQKLVLVCCLVICFLGAKSQTNTTYTITSNGVVRSYILYVPAIYNPLKPTPLVFNFHGRKSTSAQEEMYGDFRGIADTANFIIALPQGLSTNGCTGFNDIGSVASVSVDVGFTSELIDTISAHYNINACKIYSTGFSNGGAASYDLACFLSSRFAAVASVAGGMIASHANACKPVHPVPAMVIHGTEDTDVPYGGGGDSATFLAVDTVVKLWVGINNCPSNPITSAIPNTNISDNCTAYHYVYANGTGKSSVELYQVKDGGHTWPGSAYELPHNNTNMDFSASKEIWRFFRQYCLSALYTIDKIEKEALDFNLYPNPTNGLLNFSLNKPSDDLLQIEVFDILGNLVLHQKTANNFIAVDELTTGIYFLHLKQNNKNLATVKFIKE